MFYRLIIENYRSFGEPVQFDLFPNLKRENLKGHVYSSDKFPSVMKMTGIYGANGAGKSNLFKAFEFIKSFCSEFNSNRKLKDWYNKNRFRLPPKDGNQPISFIIEFSYKGQAYILSLDIDDAGVKKEELLLSGMGVQDNVMIYQRNYDHIVFSNVNNLTVSPEIKGIIERQLKSFANNSFIAINGNFELINFELIKNPFNWFSRNFYSLSYFRNIPQLIDLLSNNPGLMRFINNVFANIGLGLKNLDVKEESFEDWYAGLNDEEKGLFGDAKVTLDKNQFLTRMENDRPIASISEKDGAQIVRELLFKQFGKEGYVGDMDVSCQSNGTIKLLILMPALYHTLVDDTLVVVDELDNCLHPKLLKGLIKLVGQMPSKGQLIFTTHEDYLLDQQEILRPDEIWITDKQDGISQLYSLNDFKLHKTLSIRNGYLDDRFGGTPHINLSIPSPF